jgi:hypothetical protein
MYGDVEIGGWLECHWDRKSFDLQMGPWRLYLEWSDGGYLARDWVQGWWLDRSPVNQGDRWGIQTGKGRLYASLALA